MRILLINGPNLNMLGEREPEVYGRLTLAEIESKVAERAKALGAELRSFQSNHEGAIVDFIQQEAPAADGLIINGGALTHYGLSLRDALAGAGKPAIEVHISNIYGRERFRRRSVTADVCRGLIAGLGWHGYVAALEALVDLASKKLGAPTDQ
ncbi:MAG: type II 3-dehydroquinate dehydratase, partial [Dehalococcoidia bacterium]|nr:type II 3-dehydroquinate dehydratase [Dehalococcoidia bacterium]